MDIDAVINEKIEGDADFQTSIADFSDEDKQNAINEKRSEIIKSEFSSLSESKKKAEQIAKDQKLRAEKAEEEVKKSGSAKEEGLSQDDVIYVAKADIHEDDVKEVLGYAKKMGISAKEAHNFYKPILKERAEERKTAEATQIKGGARAITKDTPDSLIAKANKGEEVDPEKLADARMSKLLESKK